MTFISGRLVQEDINKLTKKNVISVGCSVHAKENLDILAAVLTTTATKLETLQLDDTATALQNDNFLTALTQNDTIRFLNLRSSGCDDNGAIALATVLRKNSTLQTISLNDNNISDVGAKALAEALKENTAVQKLYLNDNIISEEGAKALADARRGIDGKLQIIISLRRNKLTDEAFAAALKESPTIYQRRHVDSNDGREEELAEKSPTTISSPIISEKESAASNKISNVGAGVTAKDTNTWDRLQMNIDNYLAERKLMKQQLDNLSTARHEARDELAAKDAMLRKKDDELLTQRKQFDQYQRRVDKLTAEQQRNIQQLEDKLSADNALAAGEAAAKDAELKMKYEETLNLLIELEQMEAAKVAAETKAVELNTELRIKNDLVKMKDAEFLHLRTQLNIQLNELETKIMVGLEQQSNQKVDKLSADVARVKAIEASKDAELTMAKDLLKMKDEELLKQRKQLDVFTSEINSKEAELKKKNEELLGQISGNEELRESSDEMKRRVEQMYLQNAEFVATNSNLKKRNEDLSAENSQLTAQVDSLSESLKYAKVVDLVDLTTEPAEHKSGEDSQGEEQLPSKRRRLTNGVVVSPNQTNENEGNQNTETSVETTQRSQVFWDTLERHKADVVELLRESASKGEKVVSVVAIVEARKKNFAVIQRVHPFIDDQQMTTAFSRAENDAHREYVQSAAHVVHRPHRLNLE